MENKKRGLSAAELTMMALGTIIGGSFFIGSSIAIKAVGPSIIFSYVLGAVLVYFILSALSRMTEEKSSNGSFMTFASMAFGNGTGFVVGWAYWTGMILAMSSEAAALSILFKGWFPNTSTAIFGSVVIAGITLVNLIGVKKIGKLESSLVAFKLLAIISFILIGLSLIFGFSKSRTAVGTSIIGSEYAFSGGLKKIAGSMLTVMFAYAGFEIIGLAASDTENSKIVVKKASLYTVSSLAAFYVLSVAVILLLIPSSDLTENISPMAASLDKWGITWAGNMINIVMFIAILSTMLAAMFGLGRMIRSLSDSGCAPRLLKDTKSVPFRGIVFSGFAMLLGLMFGLMFPRVYIFLVSSGGFLLLFTYIMIVASELRICRNTRKFQYCFWFTMISLAGIILSMPFIQGQLSGLIAGTGIIVAYSIFYILLRLYERLRILKKNGVKIDKLGFFTEFSRELIHENRKNTNNK